MDAQPLAGAAMRGALTIGSLLVASGAGAASFRTTNFVVQAPTPALAAEIGRSAEQWRTRLANEWLGREMPRWAKPCPIQASVAPHLGAGGETSFVFDRGEVFGWTMKVQGSRERVLDSVLPHEITHTVFATHFRRPLPRWADEGACTTVEHPVEIGKQERMLIRFLKTGKGIPFHTMFALKEYPRDVMPLYSQGHSVTTYLIERRGKRAFLAFLEDGMAGEQWNDAVREHYGHDDLRDLQQDWMAWVWEGRPRLALETPPTVVAAAEPRPAARVALASATGTPTAPRQSVYAAANKSPRPPRRGVYDASRGSQTLLR